MVQFSIDMLNWGKQQSKPLFKTVLFCIHPINDADKANMQTRI